MHSGEATYTNFACTPLVSSNSSYSIWLDRPDFDIPSSLKQQMGRHVPPL